MKKICYASIFEILYQARGSCYTRYDMFDRIGWALNLNDSDWKKNGEAPDQSFKSQISNGHDPIPKKVKLKIIENTYSANSLAESIEKNILSPDMIEKSQHTAISRTLIDVLENDSEISPETIFFSEKEHEYTKEWLINNGDTNLPLLLGITLLYSFIAIDNRQYHKSDPITLTTSLIKRCINPLPTIKKFDNIQKVKRLLEIGANLCELKIIFTHIHKIAKHDRIQEIIEQIEKRLPRDFRLETGSYDAVYSSILDFYSKNDIVSYYGIKIGFYLAETDKFADSSIDLKLIPNNILLNPSKIEEISKIPHMSIENKLDQITKYLVSQYSENTQEVNPALTAEHIDQIFDFLSQNCSTLTKAKDFIRILIKENQIVANQDIQKIWEIFYSAISKLSEDEYPIYLKYRVCPNFAGEDVELFEAICMDNIEIITDNSDSRQDAIQLAEQSLYIGRLLNTERDVRIFSRVAYEFSIASDNEFDMLKEQIDMMEQDEKNDN